MGHINSGQYWIMDTKYAVCHKDDHIIIDFMSYCTHIDTEHVYCNGLLYVWGIESAKYLKKCFPNIVCKICLHVSIQLQFDALGYRIH